MTRMYGRCETFVVYCACHVHATFVSCDIPCWQAEISTNMWHFRQKTVQADFVELSTFWSQKATQTYQSWLSALLQVSSWFVIVGKLEVTCSID